MSAVSSQLSSRSSPPWNLGPRVFNIMDSIYAIAFGLGLRTLLDAVSQDFKLTGSLIGLWEGVITLHFLKKMPKSSDPYIAFGVRLFVDLLVTESVERLVLVLIWTAFGMVLADVAPGIWDEVGLKRVWRHFRRDLYTIYDKIPKVAFFPPPRTVRFLPSREPSVVNPSIVTTEDTPIAVLPPSSSAPSEPLKRRVPGYFPGDYSDTETDRGSIIRSRPSPRTEVNDALVSDLDDGNQSSAASSSDSTELADEPSFDHENIPDMEEEQALVDIKAADPDPTTPKQKPRYLLPPTPSDSAARWDLHRDVVEDVLHGRARPELLPNIPDSVEDGATSDGWEKIQRGELDEPEERGPTPPAKDTYVGGSNVSLPVPVPVPIISAPIRPVPPAVTSTNPFDGIDYLDFNPFSVPQVLNTTASQRRESKPPPYEDEYEDMYYDGPHDHKPTATADDANANEDLMANNNDDNNNNNDHAQSSQQAEEDAAKKLAEEADRVRKEEEIRKEEERIQKEEEERIQKEAEERLRKEEAEIRKEEERIQKEEEERIQKEAEERLRKEEEERIQKEEEERIRKEEEERVRKEEEERIQKEEEERIRKEEERIKKEKKKAEIAERKKKEEDDAALRKQKLEEEKAAEKAAKKKEKEEEKKRKEEEAEQKRKEEAEKEEKRKEEQAEKKRKEQAERKKEEEVESKRKAEEEAQKEEERKREEEEDQKARDAAEKQKQEEAARQKEAEKEREEAHAEAQKNLENEADETANTQAQQAEAAGGQATEEDQDDSKTLHELDRNRETPHHQQGDEAGQENEDSSQTRQDADQNHDTHQQGSSAAADLEAESATSEVSANPPDEAKERLERMMILRAQMVDLEQRLDELKDAGSDEQSPEVKAIEKSLRKFRRQAERRYAAGIQLAEPDDDDDLVSLEGLHPKKAERKLEEKLEKLLRPTSRSISFMLVITKRAQDAKKQKPNVVMFLESFNLTKYALESAQNKKEITIEIPQEDFADWLTGYRSLMAMRQMEEEEGDNLWSYR